MKEKTKNEFIQDRLWSLFDNIVANVVIIVLGIAIPAIIGFIFRLEIQLTLLIVLLVGQVIGLFLLFRIHKKSSSTKTEKHMLARSAETNSYYLIDDFGLPHLITDEDTLLYFMDIFGHSSHDVPQISTSRLKPIGADVVSIGHWRRPRTMKDERTAEARASLKVLPKYPRVQNSNKGISFNVRNDNEQILQINSAKLFFDVDAPITVADISPKNEPKVEGLLICKLLFDGSEKSKSLLPQREYRLDLFLDKNLSKKGIDRMINSRLGYVEITGLFRDTEVKFHVDV